MIKSIRMPRWRGGVRSRSVWKSWIRARLRRSGGKKFRLGFGLARRLVSGIVRFHPEPAADAEAAVAWYAERSPLAADRFLQEFESLIGHRPAPIEATFPMHRRKRVQLRLRPIPAYSEPVMMSGFARKRRSDVRQQRNREQQRRSSRLRTSSLYHRGFFGETPTGKYRETQRQFQKSKPSIS